MLNDDPNNTTVINPPPPVGGLPTTPSIISIPPQFATTAVWIGVGVAIGIWIMMQHTKNQVKKG